MQNGESASSKNDDRGTAKAKLAVQCLAQFANATRFQPLRHLGLGDLSYIVGDERESQAGRSRALSRDARGKVRLA